MRISTRQPHHDVDSPVLYFLYTVLIGFAVLGLSRCVLIVQGYFLLSPDERFPVESLQSLRQAPSYFWPYVDVGSKILAGATWWFLWRLGKLPLNWTIIPVVIKKFFLWWGVGLTAAAITGQLAATGSLEAFLNDYMPFIWEETETTRPGQIRETFLPVMSEDSFSGLVDVSLILGVVANAAWFVLRYLYYEFIRATSPNGPDRSALQDALQGVPIREEN